MAFRAKGYVNRKDESKLQVSGDQKEFALLVKGDDATVEAFNQAVAQALTKPTPSKK